MDNCMRKHWRAMAHELLVLVLMWLVLVYLSLHACHVGGHVLKKLHLCSQELLHRRIHLTLLLSDTRSATRPMMWIQIWYSPSER
jgi:hypothetical protein